LGFWEWTGAVPVFLISLRGGFPYAAASNFAVRRFRSTGAVICVYYEAGNVIETHARAGGVQRAVAWRYIDVRVVWGKIVRYSDGWL
jgi:hypothetical protein